MMKLIEVIWRLMAVLPVPVWVLPTIPRKDAVQTPGNKHSKWACRSMPVNGATSGVHGRNMDNQASHLRAMAPPRKRVRQSCR
jgi:hypothetical protein